MSALVVLALVNVNYQTIALVVLDWLATNHQILVVTHPKQSCVLQITSLADHPNRADLSSGIMNGSDAWGIMSLAVSPLPPVCVRQSQILRISR